MAVSEAGLAAVLNHCRELLDGAEQLESVRDSRAVRTSRTLAGWTGDYSDVFRQRLDEEADDLRRRAKELRAEAEAWARVWANSVNESNPCPHRSHGNLRIAIKSAYPVVQE